MRRQTVSTLLSKIKSTVVLLEFIVLTVLILYIGKPLFISLGFAFLISIVLYPFCKWLERKGIHKSLAIAIPFFSLIFLVIALGYVLLSYVLNLSSQLENIKLKLQSLLDQLNLLLYETLGLSAEKHTEIFQDFTDSLGSDLLMLSGGTVSSISASVFFVIMIPIFAYLILMYRHKLVKALYNLFPLENRNDLYEIITETIKTYYAFIKGTILIYLIVGVLNSIGLAIIGVPNPIIFGFIVSVFTFIPYVGIMIASLLPITVAWITYDSVWYPIAIIIWFAIVQLLEAYLIFPYIIGKQLQVNILIMFIMIILGGLLWGAAGMILFIPLVSLLKILASKTKKLKFISELLNE